MYIKSIILAAAVVATGSVASADTYFGVGRTLDQGSTLELGLITAEGKGTVEIYDYSRGQQGELLGTDVLRAGANPDVRVNTGSNTSRDVLAVVTVGGETVATKAFDVNG